MAYFQPLNIAGQVVAFDHLEPISLVVPTTTKPDGARIDVVFSNHCFTVSFDPQIHAGQFVSIWDGNRPRVFDHVRYDLSMALPAIVQGLPNAPVFMTPEANFVRITAPANLPGVDYRMFFRVIKADKGSEHDLKLRVESAYSPNPGQAVPARDMTKIRFTLLIDKTLRGEKVRRHYKR